MILRPYQSEAYDCILKEFETTDTTLAVLATALGKTVIFSHVIKHFLDKGRVMVLAHREELITQAQEKIKRVTGVQGDIEMGEQTHLKQAEMQ